MASQLVRNILGTDYKEWPRTSLRRLNFSTEILAIHKNSVKIWLVITKIPGEGRVYQPIRQGLPVPYNRDLRNNHKQWALIRHVLRRNNDILEPRAELFKDRLTSTMG